MEIKMRSVPGPGEKSVQEVEKQLLEGQEETTEEPVEEQPTEQEQPEEQVEQPSEARELSEEDVLSFIKNRYEKEINSVEDLFATTETNEELPEDVSAFLKYKKETGRGIQDFMKLNVDYDGMNDDQLLREYYASTEEDLDSEDIDYLLGEKFSYDEELDEESDVKAKKIAKKKELAKARKHFNELKETYKVPVESTGSPVNEDELETYNAYKKYISESQSIQEQNQKRSEYFLKRTDDLFSDEFKGFEFEINDQKVLFSPGDAKELKSVQSDVNNFISKHLDDEGMIKDASGYHKALAAALNPDKLAKFFYEKGKADAVDSVSKQSKNINMDVRSAPQQMTANDGVKFRVVNPDSGNRLKIRSKK